MASKYPQIARTKTFGYSNNGQPLWALEISDHPDQREMEPRIRLTGTIHGDEYISGEMLIKFISYLLENYDANQEVKNLIDNSFIAFIPVLNPDGYTLNTRYNANGVDLNRNFSVSWQESSAHGTAPFSEKESKAFRDYSLETNFHLSATFHSGAVIVNLPFDYGAETDGVLPQEYDLVEFLGKTYTTSGSFLYNKDLLNLPEVELGFINGGDWYTADGSLQDWSYLETGCLDLTIEISTDNPQTEQGVEEIFVYNKNSLLGYIASAQRGIFGQITDAADNIALQNVYVFIENGDLITNTDVSGYFHKILLPGKYNLIFSLSGYEEYRTSIELNESAPSLQRNFCLSKEVD